MVGARVRYEEDRITNIHVFDHGYLTRTFAFLAKQKVGVRPDFKIEVMDSSTNENFLTTPSATDIIITCYIDDWIYNGWGERLKNEKWEQAAVRAGAQYVVSIGGSEEIGLRDFDEHYKWVANDGQCLAMKHCHLFKATESIEPPSPKHPV